jgi:hypothetical protein
VVRPVSVIAKPRKGRPGIGLKRHGKGAGGGGLIINTTGCKASKLRGIHFYVFDRTLQQGMLEAKNGNQAPNRCGV